MGQKSIVIQEEIQELHKQLLDSGTAYEPPTLHHFVDGMYCRESIILKGTLGIGATHRKACFNLLTEGTILVSNGKEDIILKAPQTFIGSAGIQKIGYALTDVVWVNVFRTDAASIEEAEQELFEEELYKAKEL